MDNKNKSLLDQYIDMFYADPVDQPTEYWIKGCAYFIISPLILFTVGILAVEIVALIAYLLGF